MSTPTSRAVENSAWFFVRTRFSQVVQSFRDGKRLHRCGLLLLLFAATFCMAAFAGQLRFRYAFVASCFAAGLLVFLLWRVRGFRTWHVLVVAFGLRLTVAWLPPTLSDDAYRYVWDGLIQAANVNPYAYVPSDPAVSSLGPADLLERLNSSEFYSVYPPVSQVIFFIGALAGEGDWLHAYYAIKLLFIVLECAGLVLLARFSDPRTLILYAWNPLVVMETAGQAHTESAAIFFLILTLWAAQRYKSEWAAVALTLAGYVKLYPFVLFPFLWRRFGWRSVWPGVVTVVLIAIPYADVSAISHVAQSLDLYVRYFEFNAGPYYAIKEVWRFWTGSDVSKTLGPALRYIFLALLPCLYLLDAQQKWPIRKGFVWTLGAFFLLTTTVHPWYTLGVLALTATAPRPAWHWLWLGVCSIGTYLFYAGGPYWTFVILGWGGWLVLAMVYRHDEILQTIQRIRAYFKYLKIKPYLPAHNDVMRVLDLGAGEGYVGEQVRDKTDAEVTLADVLTLNRTSLPHVIYDGRALPFPDDYFDVVILYFVLHHCEDQRQVLREAVRVCRGQVLVVESVYETNRGLSILSWLDKNANRWRSRGQMDDQEEHLHFRTVDGWIGLFHDLGLTVPAQRRWGRIIHKQAIFVLDPT